MLVRVGRKGVGDLAGKANPETLADFPEFDTPSKQFLCGIGKQNVLSGVIEEDDM